MKLKLISFVCFLCFFVSSAQNNSNLLHYKNTSLTKVLKVIETKFGITFTFNTNEIAKQKVTIHLKNPSIGDIIKYLETNYQLSFNKVDDQFYTLTLLNNIKICGYLMDALDGNPIANASILNNQKGTGSVSNTDGFFEIKNNRISDTITITFLGFKTLKIPAQTLKNKNCVTYTMFSENAQLNEVVIQNYLSSGVVKTNDGAIKLKPNNLDILAGQSEPDVLQTIQLLPGVESPNENATGLNVRGGSPDQNLLLWDGIKMYNSDHFFGMLSAFNPNITESVRFYRSGANPIYGDRISGIIDIKTKSKTPYKLKGGVGINTTHADAYLHIPVAKKTSLLLSARRSLTDIVNTPTINNYATSVFQNTSINRNLATFENDLINENGEYYFTDYTLKLSSKLSKNNTLTLSSIYTKNSLEYSLNVDGFTENSLDDLSIINYGGNITWDKRWSNTFTTLTEVYLSNYDLNYFGVNPFLQETLITRKTNTIEEFGIKLHTNYQLNSNISLINGYNFFNNQVAYRLQNLNYFDIDDRSNPTHSFYSGFNYKYKNSWNIDIGLRAEYYSILDKAFLEPRIYIEHQFNDYMRFSFTGEFRNQAISQILEFASLDFGLENQVWSLVDGEDNLLLNSDQLSLGFSYNKNGWKFDTDFYYKNILGFTSFTRGFAPSDMDTNFSEGHSIILGLDILIKKRINNYVTWLGYTYSNNTFNFDDLNQGASFRANNNSKHSLTWSQAYTLNNFQFSMGWKFRTGIPYTQALGISDNGFNSFINYANINAETLPSYHRLDASAVYNFSWSKNQQSLKAKIGCSILNLYNRNNILNRSFTITRVPNEQNNLTPQLKTINRTSLPITPTLFLRIDF